MAWIFRLSAVGGIHLALLLAVLAAAPVGSRAPALSAPVMVSFVEIAQPEPVAPQPRPPEPQSAKPEPKPKPAPAPKKQPAPRPVPTPEPLAPSAVEAEPSPAAPVAAPALPAQAPSAAATTAAETAAPPAPLPVNRPPPMITSGLAYVRAPVPEYPPAARRMGEEGKVVVRVLINERGNPEQAEVHESSGSPRLDEAARRAALRAAFKPYIEGGRAISAYALIPIRFQLN